MSRSTTIAVLHLASEPGETECSLYVPGDRPAAPALEGVSRPVLVCHHAGRDALDCRGAQSIAAADGKLVDRNPTARAFDDWRLSAIGA